jgi:hypothetical protein
LTAITTNGAYVDHPRTELNKCTTERESLGLARTLSSRRRFANRFFGMSRSAM